MRKLAQTYQKLHHKLASYDKNEYGVKVNIPRFIIPEKATQKDVDRLVKELDRVQTRIAQETQRAVLERKAEAAYNSSLNNIVFGDRPDFKSVKSVTKSEAAKRQAEYEKLRRSLQNSIRYYQNRYGVELPSIPRLDKDFVPSKKQLSTIRSNINSMKKAVRADVREEKQVFSNISTLVRAAKYDDNQWTRWKAQNVEDTLLMAYNNDPKGVTLRARELGERLYDVVERYLYMAYQTTDERMGSTTTSEAYNAILKVAGEIAGDKPQQTFTNNERIQRLWKQMSKRLL